MYWLKRLSLLLIVCSLQAQQSLDSSYVSSIQQRIEDSKAYFKTNLDSTILLLDQIAEQVQSVNDPNLSAEFLLTRAQSMLFTEEYQEILPLLRPNFARRDSIDSAFLADSYRTYGEVYRQLWEPDSALVNYIEALRLFEKIQDNKGRSKTYLGLGMVYVKLKNEPMASDFFNRSMEFAEDNALMEAHQSEITDQSIRPVGPEKTLELAFDILKIAEAQNNARMAGIAYGDIRIHYYKLGNYSEALKYAELELEARRQTASQSLIATNLYFIGDIHLRQKRPDPAISSFTQALPMANDTLRLSIYDGLKSAYRDKGQLGKALGFADAHRLLKDSLVKAKNNEVLAETMARFQTEIQQEQIKTLRVTNELNEARISNQRKTLYGAIGGAVLLLFLGFMGYKNYRSTQQLKQSQLNSKLLNSQMNPHFMFNALNEIKLSLKKSEATATEANLTAYSRLMRLVLESTTRDFVPLKDEVELVSRYLELQHLVSGKTFNYSVNVDEELDLNYLKIPPMMTQPFIENAIVHGVKGIDEAEILVNYEISEDSIAISIKDNGKGFDVISQEQHGKSSSVALSNIKERIKAYENLHNFKLELQLDSKPGNGTSVSLSLPQELIAQ